MAELGQSQVRGGVGGRIMAGKGLVAEEGLGQVRKARG